MRSPNNFLTSSPDLLFFPYSVQLNSQGNVENFQVLHSFIPATLSPTFLSSGDHAKREEGSLELDECIQHFDPVDARGSVVLCWSWMLCPHISLVCRSD